MKKIILIAVLIIGLALLVLRTKAQISIGAKVGNNFAMTTDTTTSGYTGVLKKGIQYGAIVSYNMNERISLQSEILYTVKGCKEVSGKNFNQLDMNYIEIPLMAKYSFGKKSLKGYAEAGPYFAYWKSGSIKYKKAELEMNEDQEYKFEDFTIPNTNTTLKDNRIDLGVNIGCGATYEFGPGNILLDARFGIGMLDYNKYSGDELPGWINKRNRVLTVSVGYLYNIGR